VFTRGTRGALRETRKHFGLVGAFVARYDELG
jgi:hypothetical protein